MDAKLNSRQNYVEYDRQKSRDHYRNNVESYQLKNALYRLRQGRKVNPELIKKLYFHFTSLHTTILYVLLVDRQSRINNVSYSPSRRSHPHAAEAQYRGMLDRGSARWIPLSSKPSASCTNALVSAA